MLDEFLDLLPRARLAGGVPRGARVRHARSTAARGFHEVYLGDEAIIPCDAFTLSGQRE